MERISIVKSTLLLFPVLSTICAQYQQCTLSPVVRTKLGPVQGCVQQTLYTNIPYLSYKGIPYAEPPIGDNRFKPPKPAKPWTEVYKATEEGQVCIQDDVLFFKKILGDENCLYLNVYTPQVPNAASSACHGGLLCVIVWFYGGSFITGYKDQVLYGPDLLIENGCVFVIFNYRLGALGFLNLGIKEAMGNQGLKDQTLALKWVKDNIEQFCGDPNNVTIVGHSAGSSAVLLHTMSPMSKGLYNRCIALSGSPIFLFQTREWAHYSAELLGKKMGFNTSNYTELWENLMKASALEIVRQQNVVYGLPSHLTLAFMPSEEDASVPDSGEIFLSEPAWKLVAKGNFTKQPYMIGKVDNELLGFGKNLMESLQIPIINNSISYHMIANFYRVISDLTFSAAIDANRRFLVAHNKGYPTYYYLIKYNKFPKHLLDTIPVKETVHGDDVGMIFTSCEFSITSCDKPDQDLYAFRRKVAKLWTNFAKYGNPTPAHDNPIDITWEPSGFLGEQLIIDEPFRMAISSG